MDEWRFPVGVRGWLSEAEGRELARLAAGKRVLEIGSFEGRSTICLAQAAASVTCVDPLDGRSTPVPGDTHDTFLTNLRDWCVRDRVRRIHVGTTAEVAADIEGTFDLVFIDGDHSQASLAVDIREGLRLLAPGGLLAFHDYESAPDPDVTVAVNQLLTAGAETVSRAGSVIAVRPGDRRVSTKPVVFLAMPCRGEMVSHGACQGFFLWPTNGACEVVRSYRRSSILDYGFNCLWSAALNNRKHGVSHFAMCHDDVAPCQGWLDILLAELARTGADIVSAAVPIKTEEGVTSTAVETDDVWLPRRLTMTEVYGLPETFTDADVGGEILLNTGLWVCDLRRPWADTPHPLTFQTRSRIVADSDGEWQAQVRSEDWEFSRAARARGAKLAATRKVSLYHAGEAKCPNDRAWGTWATDEAYVRRNGKAARPVGV